MWEGAAGGEHKGGLQGWAHPVLLTACYLDTLRLRKFIKLLVLLSVLFCKHIKLPGACSQSPPSCVSRLPTSPSPTSMCHEPCTSFAVEKPGQNGGAGAPARHSTGTQIPIVLEYALNWVGGGEAIPLQFFRMIPVYCLFRLNFKISSLHFF